MIEEDLAEQQAHKDALMKRIEQAEAEQEELRKQIEAERAAEKVRVLRNRATIYHERVALYRHDIVWRASSYSDTSSTDSTRGETTATTTDGIVSDTVSQGATVASTSMCREARTCVDELINEQKLPDGFCDNVLAEIGVEYAAKPMTKRKVDDIYSHQKPIHEALVVVLRQHTPSLRLFMELSGEIKDGTRRIDTLVFTSHGENSLEREKQLELCMLQNAVLPIELKRNLRAKTSEALRGVRRDAAHALPSGVPPDATRSIGLVGDGRFFQLYQFSFVDQNLKVDKSSLFVVESLRNVVEWLGKCYLVGLSAFQERRRAAESDDCCVDVVGEYTFVRGLGLGGSCAVFQISKAGDVFAVKIARSEADKPSAESRVRQEVALLSRLRNLHRADSAPPCLHFGEEISAAFQCPSILTRKIAICTAETACVCSEVDRKSLAHAIYKLHEGVQWLHQHNFLFIDWHPGNVLLSRDSSANTSFAWLSDFGSTICLNDNQAHSLAQRRGWSVVSSRGLPSTACDWLGWLNVLSWPLESSLRKMTVRKSGQFEEEDDLPRALAAARKRTCEWLRRENLETCFLPSDIV